MGLEVGEFISDLVQTNPITASDPVTEGSDHLRLLKKVLQQSLGEMPGLLQFPDNNKFFSMSNVAADGFINMIKVNLDDEVEIGAPLTINGGLIVGSITSGAIAVITAANITGSFLSSDAGQIHVFGDSVGTIQIDGSSGILTLRTGGDGDSGVGLGAVSALTISAGQDIVVPAGTLTVGSGDRANVGSPAFKVHNAGSDRLRIWVEGDSTVGYINDAVYFGLGNTAIHIVNASTGVITMSIEATNAGGHTVVIPNGILLVTEKVTTNDVLEIDRAAGFGTIQHRIGASLKWTPGLRGSADNNYYIFNESGGAGGIVVLNTAMTSTGDITAFA